MVTLNTTTINRIEEVHCTVLAEAAGGPAALAKVNVMHHCTLYNTTTSVNAKRPHSFQLADT